MIKNWRDMTNAELKAWGLAEHEQRLLDLKSAEGSAEGLARAQREAKKRRLAIGATMGQAFTIIRDARGMRGYR